ncbi:MAG: methyltransferase domain-containing protein [Bdellovibrionales bacterium]|nr:methyltransferase domain-containing protein [Bdellovibrionales bacterium]
MKFTADAVVCTKCANEYPLINSVVTIHQEERPEICFERDAARDTERVPELGGINEEFSDLARAQGQLREAILSLPYGNASKYFHEEGYFKNGASHAPAVDYLLSKLRIAAGIRLLDLGADLTWSTQLFAKAGAKCIAMDINHHLEVGRLYQEAFDISYDLLSCDMHKPVFAEQSFDVITALSVLHHSSALNSLTAHLAKLLRPGGVIAVLEPYCLYDEDKQHFGTDQIEAGINENVYTLDEWHQALSAAGLVLEDFLLGNGFCALYRKNAGSSRGLFDSFYDGAISEVTAPKSSFNPGDSIGLKVVVENLGKGNWLGEGLTPVNLSYHLFKIEPSGERRLLTFDNPRLPIVPHLPAGETRDFAYELSCPSDAGEYEAVFDLVRERVTWFEQQGFSIGRFKFTVG